MKRSRNGPRNGPRKRPGRRTKKQPKKRRKASASRVTAYRWPYATTAATGPPSCCLTGRGRPGRPFPASALDGVLGYQAAMAEQLGIAYELLEAGVRRSLGETPDGQLFLRPGRERAREAQEAMAGLDPFALYRRVTRPLLIARALRPNP